MNRTMFLLVLAVALMAAIGLATVVRAQMPPPLGVAATVSPVPPAGEGPWVVRAYYSDPLLPRQLASRLEPWEVHPEQGYLVAEVDRETYEWMQSAGFRLEVDAELTRQMQQPLIPLPGQASGIPAFPCYRTVEETYATAEQIAADYPTLATWEDVGDSWEKGTPGGLAGYDLQVLHLSNSGVAGPKPGLFIMSSVHAREYAPAELNLRFAEYLVENYASDPDVTWVLDYTDIYLLFQSNPDGRKQAESGLSWRKNTDNLYCTTITNSRGATSTVIFRSSGTAVTARATINVARFTAARARLPSRRHKPSRIMCNNTSLTNAVLRWDSPVPADAPGLFLDLHSYGGLVLWPWGFTSLPSPNAAALQTLGRKLAFFNGYTPEQSYWLYTTDGTSDDFVYGELGLAAYTIEMGTAFFQGCTSFESTIVPQNLTALLYAAKAARSPYLSPVGPETLNLAVTPPVIDAGELLQISAVVDDTRFNNSQGNEAVQTITAGEYSIDTPIWQAGATHPLTATDGSFNQSVEGVLCHGEQRRSGAGPSYPVCARA